MPEVATIFLFGAFCLQYRCIYDIIFVYTFYKHGMNNKVFGVDSTFSFNRCYAQIGGT